MSEDPSSSIILSRIHSVICFCDLLPNIAYIKNTECFTKHVKKSNSLSASYVIVL